MIPVEDKMGKYSYSPDQKWAEPDLQNASAIMRYVFENRDEAKNRGDKLKKYVRDNFAETRIIPNLISTISKGK